MTKPNLVVTRAGKNSLHPNWLDLPYEARNFDLVLSFFDEEAYRAFTPQEGVSAVYQKGGKWDGLHAYLSQIDLAAYAYYWLPDDDIDTNSAAINKIFSVCAARGLAVAQPALTRDSYYSHFIFSQCPGFSLRYTNYIEIMVPCLSRAVLTRALPLFAETMSGFGLDYIWCRWPESGAYRVAILDSVSVHHTRPVGKVLSNAIISASGQSRKDEHALMKARYKLIGRTVPLAIAGELLSGDVVDGRAAMGRAMTKAWWPERAAFRDPRNATSGILKTLRRQYTKPLDMSRID